VLYFEAEAHVVCDLVDGLLKLFAVLFLFEAELETKAQQLACAGGRCQGVTYVVEVFVTWGYQEKS
jgi:hypothetical protein